MDGVWNSLLNHCVPCCLYVPWCMYGRICTDTKVESSPGESIDRSAYVSAIEHRQFTNHKLDSVKRSAIWRTFSSAILVYISLVTCFLSGILPLILSVGTHSRVALEPPAIVACFSGMFVVLIRTLQTLVKYWYERELRHSTEVCAWGDGTVTRARPLSLFICIMVYTIGQVILVVGILIATIFIIEYNHTIWFPFISTTPVFLLSEPISLVLHQVMENWIAGINQDYLKISLLEASDLLDAAWFKTKDSELQQKLYNFREAIIRHFKLDSLKMTYMEA